MENSSEIAKKSAAAMMARDQATQYLAIKLQSIDAGVAEMTMQVRDFMLNGHQTCHGGYIFTLADSCFAFACNSHNHKAVAFSCHITYLIPAYLGETLTARAIERNRTGRNGIYDISISNEKQQIIAEFRGQSRQIEGSHY